MVTHQMSGSKKTVIKIHTFRLLLWLLTLAVLLGSASAQQKQKTLGPEILLIQTITDDVINDANSLDSQQRTLLWAWLGVTLQKHSPDQANFWLEKAFSNTALQSSTATEMERRQQLITIRYLLKVVASHNHKLTARLTASLINNMKEAKPNERSETAEFLAMLALQVLPDNPELAARLGLTAIQMGRTGYITPLLFRLRRQNSSLADDLFNAALEIARSSYNEDLLDDLKIAAFPQVEIPSYRGETPPDALRNKFLLILAEAFLRTTVSSAEKIYVCRLAPKVVSLLNQYDSRLPEKAVIVRQAVLGCERSINKETQKSAGDSLSQEPLTIDDLVKASEEADSRSERTSYLIKAIRLARDLRKFETAIKLLDGISVDDREELKDIWSNWRWGCATDAAHEHFKKEDYASMRQILDAVPSDLRPLAQTTLANLIVGINPLSQNAIAVSIKTDKKPRPILIELMNGARSGLSSTSVKNKDKVGTYFYWGLIRLYAELAPFESVSVFYDGIKVLNKIDSSDIDIGVLPNGKDGNDLLEPLSLPPSLIEAAGSAVVLQYISSIESPSVRARFKLGLLRATLDKAQKIDRKGKQNDVPQKKSLQN